MEIFHIPLDEIKISDLNPRHANVSKLEDHKLVKNINAIGVQQPITVKKNGKGYNLITGKRRYLASKKLRLGTIPAIISEESDNVLSVWAVAENTERSPLDPLDAYEAYASLVSNGRTPANIAEQFGIPEHAVNQTMRLSSLCSKAKDLYRKGKLDVNALKVLTLGSIDEQEKILKDGITEHWIIKSILKDKRIKTDYALFDHAKYTGTISQDLFTDLDGNIISYFDDTAQYWRLQNIEVDKLCNALVKKGFKFCERYPWKDQWKDRGKIVIDNEIINIEKEYGEIIPDKNFGCLIQLRENGEVRKPMLFKIIETKETSDKQESFHTSRQKEMMASIVARTYTNNAKLKDALRFHTSHHGAGYLEDERVIKSYIEWVGHHHINVKVPDKKLLEMIKKKKWNMSKSMKEIMTLGDYKLFLTGYPQDYLDKLILGTDLESQKFKTKRDKVEALASHLIQTDWNPLAIDMGIE
tara:strand:- start:442 stop:1851 length:1410 start_codon:yes stop_codon:yes gene_type:complete